MKGVYIFSAIYMGTGLIFFALGIKEYFRYLSLLRSGKKTQGVARALSDGDNGVTLVASFDDEHGVSHTYLNPLFS